MSPTVSLMIKKILSSPKASCNTLVLKEQVCTTVFSLATSSEIAVCCSDLMKFLTAYNKLEICCWKVDRVGSTSSTETLWLWTVLESTERHSGWEQCWNQLRDTLVVNCAGINWETLWLGTVLESTERHSGWELFWKASLHPKPSRSLDWGIESDVNISL